MDQNLLEQNNQVSATATANYIIVPAVNGRHQPPPINGAITTNSKLIDTNDNNTVKKKYVSHDTPAPDGGLRAWCVMLSAFLCNSILFGIINTYGPIYITLQKSLENQGVDQASSKACE